MKKVFLVFVATAMLTTIASLKAEGTNNGNIAAAETVVEVDQIKADTVIYEFRLSLREMNKAMRLNIDQIEALQNVNREMRRGIAKLGEVPAESQQERLNLLLANNLLEVRGRVEDDQYRAYLRLLNNEFNRTGLNTILYGLDLAEK